MPKKQEWVKGWKVIKKSDRRSCTALDRVTPVQYLKNKETKRPRRGGPLAVFETRARARQFKHWYEHTFGRGCYWKIVKCKYIKSKDNSLWEYCMCIDRKVRNVPEGTAFADAVTCLE